MLGALLKSGSPERLEDIREDPRFEGWPTARPELTGFLGVPARQGEEVLGIIFVANKQSGSFTARDEELLTLFAAHAAIALRAHVRAASVLVTKDPERAGAELAEIAQLGAQAHAELRAVIDGLAPPELDGLASSLRRYAALAERAHGIPVRVIAAELPDLDPRVQAAAFRVAQEALHNALRHSGASEVSVTLSRTPGRLVLVISDDGTGFDPALAAGGLGLAFMRERAAVAGGVLRVRSAPGKGTRIRLAVPA